MLTAWANHVVIAALGVGIGMLMRATVIVAPPEFSEVLQTRRRGEGFFRGARRRSDEQAAIVRRNPRLRRVSFAQVALVIVLVAVIALSPVDLGWWTLAASIAAGVLLVDAVHRLARRGTLKPGGGLSFLDPLRGSDIAAGRVPDGGAGTDG